MPGRPNFRLPSLRESCEEEAGWDCAHLPQANSMAKRHPNKPRDPTRPPVKLRIACGAVQVGPQRIGFNHVDYGHVARYTPAHALSQVIYDQGRRESASPSRSHDHRGWKMVERFPTTWLCNRLRNQLEGTLRPYGYWLAELEWPAFPVTYANHAISGAKCIYLIKFSLTGLPILRAIGVRPPP